MTPQELSRLSGLLDEALDLEGEARQAWVDALEQRDADLGRTVRELLMRAGARETAAMLERGAEFEPMLEPSLARDFAAGQRVGPYLLVRHLGAGGMGEVWLAERADAALKRTVALKLPTLGARRAVLVQRFARERDILATLEHPNIARLYDAGLADDGQPYLALEFVEGQPIDEWCRERTSPMRERVQLVLQVAEAVAFAHDRLVLHRDLKPGNILVDRQAQVRLLDFGIAKLMEGDRTEETQLTRLGGRAFTLDYASPEQIRGEPMGTASDVYSLGVVAYELLAGARPYRLRPEAMAEMAAAVMASEVRLASATAAEPAQRRALQGDLDAILNKALKKDSRERYATVHAFAEDLRRFLAGEAVLARPDSRAYRLRKFVRRHRVPVAAGGAVAVALTAGLLVAAWQAGVAREQARRAAQQAEIAGKEARRAAAVQDFLLDIFRANSTRQADPVAAQRTTARELLDIGAARVAERLQDEPESQLAVRETLADMYLQLGLNQRAAELSERNLEQARRLHGPRSRRLAEMLVAHAATLQERGGRERVPALLQEALGVLDAAGDQASALRGEVLLETAWFWDGEAIARGRRAAEAAVAFFARHHPDARARVTAHIVAGRVHMNASELALAEAQFDAAVEVARRQGDTAATLLHDAMNHRGDAQRAQLRLGEAEASYREALQHAMRAYGTGRGETLMTQARLAGVLSTLGRRAEAEALGRQLREAIAKPDARLEGGWRAAIDGMLASRWSERGRPDLAERALRDDVAGLRKNYPRAGVTARAELELANVLVTLGRLDEAGRWLTEAGARWAVVAEGAGSLPGDATYARVAARLAQARGAAAEALAMIASVKEAAPAERLSLAIERSRALRVLGRPGEAAQAAAEVVREIETRPEAERPKALEAEARLVLGQALAAGGDLPGARAQVERAVALRRAHDDAGSLALAQAVRVLADLAAGKVA